MTATCHCAVSFFLYALSVELGRAAFARYCDAIFSSNVLPSLLGMAS